MLKRAIAISIPAPLTIEPIQIELEEATFTQFGASDGGGGLESFAHLELPPLHCRQKSGASHFSLGWRTIERFASCVGSAIYLERISAKF